MKNRTHFIMVFKYLTMFSLSLFALIASAQDNIDPIEPEPGNVKVTVNLVQVNTPFGENVPTLYNCGTLFSYCTHLSTTGERRSYTCNVSPLNRQEAAIRAKLGSMSFTHSTQPITPNTTTLNFEASYRRIVINPMTLQRDDGSTYEAYTVARVRVYNEDRAEFDAFICRAALREGPVSVDLPLGQLYKIEVIGSHELNHGTALSEHEFDLR